MISPLGQRQILQSASIETARLAMEGGFLVQREEARRQAFDARLADAQLEVPDIPESEGLKLTEKDARDHSGSQHGTGSSEDPPPDEADETPAEGARPHLDLLA